MSFIALKNKSHAPVATLHVKNNYRYYVLSSATSSSNISKQYICVSPPNTAASSRYPSFPRSAGYRSLEGDPVDPSSLCSANEPIWAVCRHLPGCKGCVYPTWPGHGTMLRSIGWGFSFLPANSRWAEVAQEEPTRHPRSSRRGGWVALQGEGAHPGVLLDGS